MRESFYVTLNHYRFDHKPNDEEVMSLIRPLNYNQVVQMDIESLANKINQGFSFYANVLDATKNTRMKNGELTKSTNGTCYVPELSRLISIDVDHGNMDLEKLKQCIHSVPHCLIYKTFSYKEEDKRYRILFLANRCFKNEAEFKEVHESLTYLFAHPFFNMMDLLPKKVDFSCRDVARISFGGTVIQEELFDRTFDLDLFIEKCCQLNIKQLIHQFKQRWKQEEKRRKQLNSTKNPSTVSKEEVKKTETTELLTSPIREGIEFQKNTLSFKTREVREALLQQVIKHLIEYKQKHRFEMPLTCSFHESISLINQIPLTELLKLENPFNAGELNEIKIGEPFCCLLPHHFDTRPSASILLNKEGRTVYYCNSCSNEHALSTFDVLEEIIKDSLGYDRLQVVKMIFDLLGISLTSAYKQEALARIQFLKEYWDGLSEDDPLIKYLDAAKLKELYMTMLELAGLRMGLAPVSTIENEKLPTFFISNRNIVSEMNKRKYVVGFKNVGQVNKKINRLVYLGFLEKIPEEEISPEMLKNSEAYRDYLIKHESQSEGLKKVHRRRMDYYRIPLIDGELERALIDFIREQKEYNIRVSKFSAKQIKSTYGEEKKKKVNSQSTVYYSKKELWFNEQMKKAIDKLINSQGYCTEDQIVALIDRNGKKFPSVKKMKNGKEVEIKAKDIKLDLLKVFISGYIKEKRLTSGKVNRERRERFKIPNRIHKNKTIYFFEDID